MAIFDKKNVKKAENGNKRNFLTKEKSQTCKINSYRLASAEAS
jgi:hypothetical protein